MNGQALANSRPNEPSELQRALNGLQTELKIALDNEATARNLVSRLGRMPPTPISEGERADMAKRPVGGLMDEINAVVQELCVCNQRTGSLLEQLNRTV